MAGRRPNFTPRPWTDDDVQLLQRMRERNIPQDQIAQALDRTLSAVEGKLRLLREGVIRPLGGQTEARYECPDPISADDDKHVRRLLRAGGFSWLRPALAQRFYALESDPRKVRAA
jgi:hypothetical protein